MGFKQEFPRIMKLGVLGLMLFLIGWGAYNFHGVEDDMDVACASCTTQDCQDNDVVCGDFGIYWWKFMILFAIIGVGVFGTIFIKQGEKQ